MSTHKPGSSTEKYGAQIPPNLPVAFLNRMQLLLGEAYPQFLEHYESPASIGLRVNTVKISTEDFTKISPFDLQKIPWIQEGFLVKDESRPGKHPYHAAGLYYLQDPSAMAVVTILEPQPGERILDLAAAPGGKTSHIASRIAGKGWLVANDVHPQRVYDLANNLERWGAQNVVILNEYPERLAAHFGAFFDRVLVDAPCSGEGMFRKDPPSRAEWRPQLVQTCAHRQEEILYHAARLVRPGGYLAYATCTFNPEENEGTVNRFLHAHPNFVLITPQRFPGFEPGHPEWLGANGRPELARTIRLWPHKIPGEGHFIALLQKREPGVNEQSARRTLHSLFSLSDEMRTLLDRFSHSTLTFSLLDLPGVHLRGNRLFAQSEGGADLTGLKVVHWGWWLGTVKKNRFEPAHALALALEPSDARHTLAWRADDPSVMKFIRGEVIPNQGPEGWVMITVDGFPLGWGKRVHGRLKSHSPKWLRWM
ncbi:MAG: RsmF rRNA methyltransferase first C-terminal domain-containing protein [Chloroflexota bacterium]